MDSTESFILVCEQRLKALMNAQHGKVCLLTEDKLKFIHMVDEKLKETDSNIGIMGECF